MSQATPQQLRITFFGDSICVGQGVSIYKGWVPKIARDLDAMEKDVRREFMVTNSSVNGRTTRQALEDMPYHLQSHEPHIMIVQFGLNDCNYWESDRGVPRVSLEAFSANIKEIIERGKRFGASAVLLNTNHPTTRDKDILPHTSISYEQSNRAYNQAVREVSKQLGDKIKFCDVEAAFLNRISSGEDLSQFLLADALHLSPKGHDLYYELVGPVLLGMVHDVIDTANKADTFQVAE